MNYRTFFDDPADLSVNCWTDDILIGVANAHVDGSTLVLTFIGVRDTHQKRGIAAEMLAHLIAEARRLGLSRLVGKEIKSAACLRLLERQVGAAAIQEGENRANLPEQPDRFIFAPSFGMLTVESKHELTAEWRI